LRHRPDVDPQFYHRKNV